MFEILGIVGIAISLGAHVPQSGSTSRGHRSAGDSSRAWAMGSLAVCSSVSLPCCVKTPYFILLQVSSLTSFAGILVHKRAAATSSRCSNQRISAAKDHFGGEEIGLRRQTHYRQEGFKEPE
jgi:hypothetical protein